ncbi:hypothetical protein BSKO_00517 [Bryopsis sp. KO-2023]|nr:hypothetical protein BSKO_00517 [Bryopsis sp. KO-2023]
MAFSTSENYDHLFKILLVGDSGVGKSCLLMRFTTDRFEDGAPSTIGVDFKLKYVTLNNKRVKLTIWDTAGQERFRTLTSSYYRGAHGIIFVYDVTRRETFEDLASIWLNEVEMYSTIEDAAKMVVANKLDLESTRQVTKEEGADFARSQGCLFVETSAKTNVAVRQAFEELVLKIMETPNLMEEGTTGIKLGLNQPERQESSYCC